MLDHFIPIIKGVREALVEAEAPNKCITLLRWPGTPEIKAAIALGALARGSAACRDVMVAETPASRWQAWCAATLVM